MGKYSDTLHHLLKAIVSGDQAAQALLCARLSSSILFVPAVNRLSENGSIVISIMRMMHGGRSVIPTFTSHDLFCSWKEESEFNGEVFELNAGDLCTMLEPEIFLMLNPGSLYSIKLAPARILEMAGTMDPETAGGVIENEDEDGVDEDQDSGVETIIVRRGLLFGQNGHPGRTWLSFLESKK